MQLVRACHALYQIAHALTEAIMILGTGQGAWHDNQHVYRRQCGRRNTRQGRRSPALHHRPTTQPAKSDGGHEGVILRNVVAQREHRGDSDREPCEEEKCEAPARRGECQQADRDRDHSGRDQPGRHSERRPETHRADRPCPNISRTCETWRRYSAARMRDLCRAAQRGHATGDTRRKRGIAAASATDICARREPRKPSPALG